MIPSLDEVGQRMLDISEPDLIEIRIDYDRGVVHVNVGGAVCAFRACKIKTIDFKIVGMRTPAGTAELRERVEKLEGQAVELFKMGT